MTTRASRWPWAAFFAFLVLAAAGTVIQLVNERPLWEDLGFLVAFGLFGVVGALIASRDPGNRIGLLFLWGCCLSAAGFSAGELVTYLHARGDSRGLGVGLAAVLSEGTWIVGILPVLLLLPLLFPDGVLPSPRWRWFMVLSLGTLVVIFGGLTLGSPTLTGSIDAAVVRNPLYVPALAAPALEGAFWLYLVFLAISASAMVLRFRRSTGVERQQIKWFAFAIVFLLVAIITSEILLAAGIEIALFDTVLIATAFLTLPVAVGVAILRYHLYDLDLVIRKTLLYGFLVVLATAVYAVIVVGLGTLVGRESSFLTMVAAVVVAVGFHPARLRMARVANRIVYGKRATPYEVLSEFSERVGEAYAADDVLPRMARVVAEGVNAEHADVWLKIGNELRVSAAWPGEHDPATSRIPLSNGGLPPIDDADVAYPVEHRGELLGALAVRKPPTEPLTPNDAKLVQDLAAQAGLVLRNVRLTEELRARLDDLKAAQRRIVTAADEARRQLERNIHDGAQQQLVALAVKARLARGMSEKDPLKAAEVIGQLEDDTTSALENLRDLARGIYPPLLADRGLTAALEAQARKAPLPVEVRANGVRRYPQEVEAAVYFSVLEAVQNVAKHAGASRVDVSFRHSESDLIFEVADDGVGFEPSATRIGTGLQGIADRLGVLDGTLDVRSSAGGGTTIVGRVPLAKGTDA